MELTEFDGASIGGQSRDAEAEGELRVLYAKWIDLHPITKDNLKRFEGGGYRLKGTARGAQEVVKLVRSQL